MKMGINGLYEIVRREMEVGGVGGGVLMLLWKKGEEVKLVKWDGDGLLV